MIPKYPWQIPKWSNILKEQILTPEWVEKLKIGEEITLAKIEVLVEVLFNLEAGIAFDFFEKGSFRPEIEPPHVIPTVDHTPWQAASFRVPKAFEKHIKEIIKAKIDCGALKRSCGPYRNPWFLVVKKAGKYRLINAAQRLNAVAIKDASLAPSVDNFGEEFSGFQFLSLLDLLSGYDPCILAPASRDMTAFMTLFGLLRMTTLPHGYTNGVQGFDKVIGKVLKDAISENCGKPCIDNVAVKPVSRSHYLNKEGTLEEVVPGVRKYVLEAIISLDKVLADIERAVATISGEKSEVLKSSLKVIAYICRQDGRTPQQVKIQRIVDWPSCKTVTDIKAFIGMCVYYRVRIQGFSVIAEPLFRLTRKN